ncbi:MAG: hypothetical protein GX684_06700 [Ruminococcaceae bacterium]|nr:hypothetical protein [Oscillospiraceae bacterium]
MQNRLLLFMQGRNGADSFSKLTSVLSVFLIALTFFTRGRAYSLLQSIALLLMIYTLYRILSKNTYKRRLENQRYLSMKMQVVAFFKGHYERWQQRKDYKFFKCSACKTVLRVPRGKGNIKVVCRKCGNSFTAKS